MSAGAGDIDVTTSRDRSEHVEVYQKNDADGQWTWQRVRDGAVVTVCEKLFAQRNYAFRHAVQQNEGVRVSFADRPSSFDV